MSVLRTAFSRKGFLNSRQRNGSNEEGMIDKIAKVLFYLMVSAIGLLSIYRSSPACQVDEFYFTKAGYLAAPTPDRLNEAASYLEKNNQEELLSMTKDGTVVELKENIKVRVLERSFEHEMLKIEFPGDETPYWVKDGALKPIESN